MPNQMCFLCEKWVTSLDSVRGLYIAPPYNKEYGPYGIMSLLTSIGCMTTGQDLKLEMCHC